MCKSEIKKLLPEVEDRKFDIGTVVMTQGVASLIAEEKIPPGFIHQCLQKHQRGDWGDICEEDQELNDRAVQDGSRILSSYKKNNITVWIITEWDRSATTALLPEEY